MIPDYSGERARNYEAKRRAQPEWIAEERAVRSMLADYPWGSTVLDVPVGTGRFLGIYLDKGYEPRGVDISPDMLSECAERGWPPLDLVQGDILIGTHLFLCDIVLCMRFLSWVDPDQVQTVVHNLAHSSFGPVIAQITTGPEQAIAGGAHVHRREVWEDAIQAAGLVEEKSVIICKTDSYENVVYRLVRRATG